MGAYNAGQRVFGENYVQVRSPGLRITRSAVADGPVTDATFLRLRESSWLTSASKPLSAGARGKGPADARGCAMALHRPPAVQQGERTPDSFTGGLSRLATSRRICASVLTLTRYSPRWALGGLCHSGEGADQERPQPLLRRDGGHAEARQPARQGTDRSSRSMRSGACTHPHGHRCRSVTAPSARRRGTSRSASASSTCSFRCLRSHDHTAIPRRQCVRAGAADGAPHPRDR